MQTTAYTLTDTDLILDLPEQGRVYKFKDLPAEEKPREKLVKYGPSALSTNELLAVILTTGTKKEDLLGMTGRLVKDYGEKILLSQRSVPQMMKELRIPLVKAAQIIASLELGRRLYDRDIAGLPTLRNAKDVYDYLGDMKSLPKENLRGLYLDAHQRVIHDEVISVGTVNSNIIHPREVFKPAFQYGAVALILAHNHPSGIAKASQADIDITRQLVEAGRIVGISLLDHVVITKHGFTSVEVEYS